MTFVGLDLHKRYITVCALDAAGGVVGEVRRMPVSLETLGDFLAVLTRPVIVGMEATLYGSGCTISSRRSDTSSASPTRGK